MAVKDRALAFLYTIERYPDEGGGTFPKKNKINDSFHSTSGDYATAINQLLDHIDKMWKGYELTINKIIVLTYI